jgi:hypothetical protein
MAFITNNKLLFFQLDMYKSKTIFCLAPQHGKVFCDVTVYSQ